MINNDTDISRRDMIKACLAGAGALAFANPMEVLAESMKAAPKAKAKSVIQIWMWGGPSHLDTFDPKPDAGSDYTGPLTKSIKTNAEGMSISSMLPLLAKQADKYSLIRSMTHGQNAHEKASYLMQTGRNPGRIVYPTVGSVVSHFKGNHGEDAVLPPYIVLTTPQGRFSESGCMGPKYKPMATGGDPNANRFVVEGIVAEGISDARQLRRKGLMQDLDSLGQAMPNDPAFHEYDKAGEAAYGRIFGKAREIFDLSKEEQDMRERYGRNTFGQSCLMARRLVQAGVPYITINYRGWDTHKTHFQTMQRKLPEMDKAMSALLTDLSQQGLLDSTILWWGGEFGRTPKVQWAPPWNGGRGHFGHCFTAMLAGGGFKGGQVVGASSSKGDEVKDRAVYPLDLIGSIYHQMGIDGKAKLPNERNMDLTVMPSKKEDVMQAGILKEIM